MIWKTLCAIWVLISASIGTVSWAQSSEVGARYCDTHKCQALLFANDAYDSYYRLNTSVDGANKVAEALNAIGFDVTVLADTSLEEMQQALAEFEARPGIDISFIYFSGHGHDLNAENILLPIDFDGETTEQVEYSSIAATTLLINQPGTDLNIAVIDAARVELYPPETTKGNPSSENPNLTATSKGFVPSEPRELRNTESIILYSTQAGQSAYDQPVFPEYLANALLSRGDIVRVLASVADEMAVKTDLYQNPELEVYSVRGRPICLVSCADAAMSARASFAEQRQELESGTCEGTYAVAASGSERYALVIGNNGYSETDSWGRLKEPVNDADTISGALEETDFVVRKCHNLPIELMRSEIEAFQTFYQTRVEDSADGTTPAAFFYFSGHGAADQETNYMIPTDSKADEADELPDDAISIDQFTSRFPDAGAQIMVVIDACRNALKNSDEKSGHKGLQPFLPRPNMIIASATMPGELAKQDSGYAKFLAERITQTVDNIYESEVEFVFRDVGNRVETATRGQQRPDTTGTFNGRFFFHTSP